MVVVARASGGERHVVRGLATSAREFAAALLKAKFRGLATVRRAHGAAMRTAFGYRSALDDGAAAGLQVVFDGGAAKGERAAAGDVLFALHLAWLATAETMLMTCHGEAVARRWRLRDERVGGWLFALERATERDVRCVAALEALRDEVEATGAVALACEHDVLGQVYGLLVPNTRDVRLRHRMGEFYSPRLLAATMLGGLRVKRTERVCDPTCGTGVFLQAAVARGHGGDGLCGVEVSPVAGAVARAAVLLASRRVEVAERVEVVCGDALSWVPREGFDVVVGNPPWVLWDHLDGEARISAGELFRAYGLFSLTASEGRHGGGKKDLAGLFVLVAIDRLLREGGRFGFVLPKSLVMPGKASEGFRAALARYDVTGVRDVDGRVFDDRVAAHIVVVEGVKRKPRKRAATRVAGETSGYVAHAGASTAGANGVYWVVPTDGDLVRAVERAATGETVRVRNLVEAGKREVQGCEVELEGALVYPLLRWGDVGAFRADPRALIVLAQDAQTRRGREPEWMQAHAPKTLRYLEGFREVLESRAAFRRYQSRFAFYSMYDVGQYTLSAWKVVWRRMDKQINAAVVGPWHGRVVVPQETLSFVACGSRDEAAFLCGLLNSAVVRERAGRASLAGSRGFGSPGIVAHLGLVRFDAGNRQHRALCEAVFARCELAAADAKPAVRGAAFEAELEAEIDRLASACCG